MTFLKQIAYETQGDSRVSFPGLRAKTPAEVCLLTRINKYNGASGGLLDITLSLGSEINEL